MCNQFSPFSCSPLPSGTCRTPGLVHGQALSSVTHHNRQFCNELYLSECSICHFPSVGYALPHSSIASFVYAVRHFLSLDYVLLDNSMMDSVWSIRHCLSLDYVLPDSAMRDCVWPVRHCLQPTICHRRFGGLCLTGPSLSKT